MIIRPGMDDFGATGLLLSLPDREGETLSMHRRLVVLLRKRREAPCAIFSLTVATLGMLAVFDHDRRSQ